MTMAKILDSQKLALAFQSRPDIIEGIKKAAGTFPQALQDSYSTPSAIFLILPPDSAERVALFNEIADHVYQQVHGSEPAHKRRRVDIGQTNGTTSGAAAVSINAEDEKVLLEVKEISVSIPQRKKFELCFTDNHLYARAPGTTTPANGIVYAWRDIGRFQWPPSSKSTLTRLNRICVLPSRARKGPGPTQLHPLPPRHEPALQDESPIHRAARLHSTRDGTQAGNHWW